MRLAAPVILAAILATTACGSPVNPAPAPAPAAPVIPATGTAVTINGTTYIPCPTDEADGPTPCFWDAGARGNGKGQSYLWDGQQITYLPR